MTNQRHYIIVSSLNLVIVLIGFVFPFILSNVSVGNGISWVQYLIAAVLLLPSVVLWVKKPKSLWVYSYLLVLAAVLLMGVLTGDAISAGMVLLFLAVPIAMIYSILVVIKVVK